MNQATPIEAGATKLLNRFGVKRIPVPVEEIASGLGAEVAYVRYEGDASGMLLRRDGRTLIGVNSVHAKTRQRFTIAHEIAHLELHKGNPMFIDHSARVNWRKGASNREEAEANAFAAELIMPRRFIQEEVEKVLEKGPNVLPAQLVARLAKRFGVSSEAMWYRLTNLGVLDLT
jgi:Zn-dependent peptidase ImmA (M78 family)